MKRILSITIISVVLASCTSNYSRNEYQPPLADFNRPLTGSEFKDDNYIIRKGDEIQIAVWGYSEFNTTTTVKEAGTIAVPLVGEVQIEGMTIDQVKKLLHKRLADYIQGDIKLTVTIGSAQGEKITVLGTVVHQESYPAKTELNLLEVLSMAGGATTDSDLRHVKIFPSGNDQYPIEIDLAWYMENGAINRLPMIRPGDVVYVPRKENVVRDFSDFARDIVVLFGFFRFFN